MLLHTKSLHFLAVFITLFYYSVQAQDVDLSDLSPELQASIETVEILRLFKGLTKAQELEEKLFIALPKDDLNKTTIDTGPSQNSTSISSTPQKKIKKRFKAKAKPTVLTQLEARQATIPCTAELWREGDDACEGRENEPGFVRCEQPCTFTRDVSR